MPHPIILVVDDDPTVLEMIARTLREAEYEVYAAHDGPSAMRIAEAIGKPLDLVVTDVQMTPIDGPELAALLFSRGLASRFLLVSGYGPVPHYNAEFGPFLAKPFSPEQLERAVAGLLG